MTKNTSKKKNNALKNREANNSEGELSDGDKQRTNQYDYKAKAEREIHDRIKKVNKNSFGIDENEFANIQF